MATEGNGDPPVPDLRTMEELCQLSLNGRGRPISLIAIQATNFELKNDMIQQSIKVNGVTDDTLRLYLFPQSLKHHATAWFDRLPRNSINTFEQMAKMFLGKYFPPSMMTKHINEITNFRQRPDKSLFEAWERYKLSIDRCPNHDMLSVTQIDTFYNGLTLRHRNTINAAVVIGTLQPNGVNQQVKAIIASYETCGGPHSYNDCPSTVGQTQNVYAAGAYQGNSYQPQGNRNMLSYHLDNYLGPPGFNQNQNRNNQNQNFQNQNRNHGIPQGSNQGRNQFFQGASHGQNPPPAYQAPSYQAPAYQALGYQAPVHQPPISQLQVMTTNEFTNFMKANDVILKNMQTNMTSLTNFNLELKNMYGQFMKMNTALSSCLGTLPGNKITNPKEDLKGITTRSGTAYQGPMIPTTSSSLPKVVECETDVTKDTVPPTNNEITKDVQPLIVQIETSIPNFEPVVAPIIEHVVAPVSAPKPNQKPLILFPSRLHDQKLRDKTNEQKEKFFQIFQDLNFNISFADALILMPKFGPTIKTLLTNKDKLSELARTPLNEHCSAVLLKKFPKKLGDPGKFLISCDFPRMAECLALADLDASINLMPLSMWNKLSLLELSPMCMTIELADRSISRQVGVAEDVFVKVGTSHFPADFVVVDFDANPRVPLILERSFLKIGRALIDVFKGELTLHVGKEAITFNLNQTSRYSANYNDMTANQIDVIDMACEEYSQEVLGFSDVIASGNPTPYYDPIVSTSSLTLTPFGDSDFLFEEVDAFLALEDDATSPEVD
uniref:Reverse transcriptase domain-containing protein n=1 Tax=Tanacetum cinerariifolium TaxID=118510 RepID=A0A699IH00_TANCI|nr:reverse transcriptase domain-containing protein [Tanacetum cinerariifolium]